MINKDLESQLEGLFSDTFLEPEAEKAKAPLEEETIFDLLEGEAGVEPVAAEPARLEIPLPAPAKLEEAEREKEEPRPADFLAWEAQLQEQRTRTLNIMLGCLAGLGSMVIISLLINLVREPGRWLQAYAPYFAAYAMLVALAAARRINPTVRATILVVLAYAVGISALLIEGPLSGGGLYLLAAPLLFFVLVGQWAGIIAAAVSSLIYTGFLLADHLGLLHPVIPYRPEVLPSVLSLISTFALISAGVMFVQWMFNRTLISALREAEQKHGETVRAQSLLEERADELGKANALLQKRALQLQTAAQVSSATTFSVLDPNELAQQIVNLIYDRFDLYYVGLFLTDPLHPTPDTEEKKGKWALLQAGTGKAGRQMLAEGYKVKLDISSTVGWCIINSQARIAPDGGRVIPILPATRSEMALPLRSRGRVIGALTLRSAERDAFSQEDIPVLQTMADQIAVATDNAQLFADAQASLSEMEKVQRHYVREQWADFVSTRPTPIYERTQPDVTPLGDTVLPEVELAMARREAVVQSDTDNEAGQATLVMPISLRDETIGVLGLHETESGRRWTDDEIALIEAVADQMALAVENVRLLEEAQRRAREEHLLGEVTARIRAPLDVDTILQTAVRELGRVMGVDRVSIYPALEE